MLRKTNSKAKAGSSRPLINSGGIAGMLHSIAPFLFKKKAAAKPVAKAAAKPEAVKRTKKKHRKKKRTQRKAIPAMEARKLGPPSASTSAVMEEDEADDATTESQDPLAGDEEVSAPKGSVRARTVSRAQTQTSTPAADVIDEAEDAWLSKVIRKDTKGVGQTQGRWSMFKKFMPFGGGSQKGDSFLSKTGKDQPATSGAQEELTESEIANDSFLQKVVQQEKAPAMASKEDVAELKKQVEKMSKEEQLAKRREEAFQKELERQKKQLAQSKVVAKEEKPAINDVKVSEALKKEEAESKITPVEDKKKTDQPPAVVIKKKNLNQKPNGFQQFLASLGHIGLGKERMMFIQNLGTMLGAGLSLVESLHTLQKETRAKPMRKIIQNVIDEVENGFPLWRAMDQQSFFTPHAIALVRIGEEAGNLAENVVYLAQQEEKDAALKGKVKMAMIYPTIVMVLMFIIVVGLGMFVLPQLLGVLTSLDVPLPLATRMIILFTNMFTEHGAVFVPSMIGGFIFLGLLSKYTSFKVVTQWVMFHIPGIGALAREATIARFGVILGGLLKAGVPVVEAMQSLVTVTPIVRYKKLYQKMLDHITVGDSFAKSFTLIKKSEKLLPPSVQQLVITGERSGALADITLKVADIYDKKASDTAQKLPVILEPMLLLFIGGLVGTIAFAIIVPIYSIVGNVGGQ
jgi:type IV pilus assembly protein PilC